MKSIGLLSGIGRLPVEVAKAARAMGIDVYAVGLVDGVEEDLKNVATDFKFINVAQLGSIIDYLKGKEVTDVVMIGKVTKEILFSGQHELPDARMIALLSSLKDRSDDTMMLAFVAELAKEGITTFDQTMLLKMIMPKKGVLTKRQPTERENLDMEFGFKMALERKTGARGLRSIMESVMMDTMYEIPSDDTIEECVVTKAAVDGESEPLTIHDESLKKAK